MRLNRKYAKTYIENATKSEYDHIVSEAFLTMRQEKILLLKRTNAELANWEIGNKLHVSVDTINHEFLRIYDKIAKVLML